MTTTKRSSKKKSSKMLKYALMYAKAEIPVFPVYHPIREGRCSCPQTKCNTVGKHPIIEGWQELATTDSRQIREWWRENPNANIGMPTGKRTRTFVLDKDKGGGEELKKHPALPPTVESITGGGGRHYFFNYPEGLKITNSTPFNKIHIRGKGGFVVLPPSLHESGGKYKWKNEGGGIAEYEPKDAPEWLLEAIKNRKKTSTTSKNTAPNNGEAERVKEGEGRNSALLSYGSSMRERKLSREDIITLMRVRSDNYYDPPLEDSEFDTVVESVFRYESNNNNKALEGVTTLGALMKMDFPEPKWIIPTLIPEGLTLVAGRPKIGKSIFCVNLSVALATGGKALGKIDVGKTGVLYLALEDTLRRLQNRFKTVLRNENPPNNLHLKTEFRSIKDEGLNELDSWLTETKGVGFVIIDTLAKIKGHAKQGSELYLSDYDAVSKIKQVADKHGIAILVIHHTRKMEGEQDVFDEILGTTGIGGAADTLIVLKKKRFEVGGGRDSLTMCVTGREVEEVKLAVSFDRPALGWVLEGDAEEYFQSKQRHEILDILKAAKGTPVRLKDIQTQIRKSPQATSDLINSLINVGLVDRVGRGLYALVSDEDY